MVVRVVAGAMLIAACSSGDDTASDIRSGGQPSTPTVPTTATASTTGITADTTASTTTSTEASKPTSTTSTGASDGDERTGLPAGDLLELVLVGVGEGAWTEAEGITLALDGVLGRSDPDPGLDPADVIDLGLTSLVRRGSSLLAEGSLSSSEVAGLESALLFFSPTQELLDSISIPAPDDVTGRLSSGVEGLVFRDESDVHGFVATPNRQPAGVRMPGVPGVIAPEVDRFGATDAECALFAGMGFDERLDIGDGLVCYVYEEIYVAANRLRLYFPEPWLLDATRWPLIADTFAAMEKSAETYADVAPVGSVNIVFSLTDVPPDSEGRRTAASVGEFEGEAPCPVVVFPAGVGQGSAYYQQTMAHEIFHCVQDRKLPNGDGDVWWVEGSAEYFGNVVYPRANKEHTRTPFFDEHSLTMNPTQMDYENTVFFQYYANRRGGPPGVWTLLGTLSAGADGLGTLAEVSGMGDLWQEFVVAFVADAILDPGGGTVGGSTKFNRRVAVDAVGPVTLEAPRMVATRYVLEFDQEKRFVQNQLPTPQHAAIKEGQEGQQQAWSRLPDEVRSKCDKSLDYVVVTTSVDGNANFVNEVTQVDTAQCDPCLLGPWQMQTNSFEQYMREVFTSIAGGMELTLVIDGNYFFEFDDAGEIIATRDNLKIGMVAGGFAAPSTKISGVEIGVYTTDGQSLTISGLGGFADVQIGGGGATSSVIMDPNGGTASYTCEDDVFTILDSSYGPLVFDRIDTVPEPESVTVETGDAGG